MSHNFFDFVFGSALQKKRVIIIPFPNKRFSFALVDDSFYIFVMKNIGKKPRPLPSRGFIRSSNVLQLVAPLISANENTACPRWLPFDADPDTRG